MSRPSENLLGLFLYWALSFGRRQHCLLLQEEAGRLCRLQPNLASQLGLQQASFRRHA
jgi:hypothetical protein